MAPTLARALNIYGKTVMRRLTYLGLTGRLSQQGLDEMRRLEEELDRLRHVERLVRGRNPLEVQVLHAKLVGAFQRELVRYGGLVGADADQTRRRSADLRARARAVAGQSHRLRTKATLRIQSAKTLQIAQLRDLAAGPPRAARQEVPSRRPGGRTVPVAPAEGSSA